MTFTLVVESVGDGSHGNLPRLSVVVSQGLRVWEEGQPRVSTLHDRPVEDESFRVSHDSMEF